MPPSIIFLVPYFGKWPAWIDYFFLSCRYNPGVQWLFYTDCTIPEDAPENVKFKCLSFSEYKQLVSDRLKIDFHPENPYKICDIKPALGFIHYDDIQGFDFWGVSDIDLVYGSLRNYFTAERLAHKDFYATHVRRVSGHLFLVRNTPLMLEAFRKIKNWQQRFSSAEHHALDEGAFSKLFIRHKNLPRWFSSLLALFNPWARRSEFVEAYSTPNGRVPWIDGSFNFPTEWYWEQGRLTNNLTGGREYPYFHFIAWKEQWSVPDSFPALDALATKFTLTDSGFHYSEN